MVTFPANPKLAGAQVCGNEPGDSLKGSRKGWFIGVIPSFPTEHQQAKESEDGSSAGEWVTEERFEARRPAI